MTARPAGVTIRDAEPEDAEAISALILSLTSFFLADPADPEAAAPFFATISPEALRANLTDGRYRYQLAESGGELAGVVGVRNDAHLYHLFVAAPFHRQGLAARLWAAARQAARAAGNPGRFTVNSSRYAVPVYRRLGFRVTGPEVLKDGIAFIPMELDEREAVVGEAGEGRRKPGRMR